MRKGQRPQQHPRRVHTKTGRKIVIVNRGLKRVKASNLVSKIRRERPIRAVASGVAIGILPASLSFNPVPAIVGAGGSFIVDTARLKRAIKESDKLKLKRRKK